VHLPLGLAEAPAGPGTALSAPPHPVLDRRAARAAVLIGQKGLNSGHELPPRVGPDIGVSAGYLAREGICVIAGRAAQTHPAICLLNSGDHDDECDYHQAHDYSRRCENDDHGISSFEHVLFLHAAKVGPRAMIPKLHGDIHR
jgi:hypothetical protein